MGDAYQGGPDEDGQPDPYAGGLDTLGSSDPYQGGLAEDDMTGPRQDEPDRSDPVDELDKSDGESAPSQGSVGPTPDPYRLRRFTSEQVIYHPIALSEMKRGRKSSCWAWYILPTLPFMKNGRPAGSPTNRLYELADDVQARPCRASAQTRNEYPNPHRKC